MNNLEAMRHSTRTIPSLALSLCALLAMGQAPGSLDISFLPEDLGHGIGDGASTGVLDIQPLDDGRAVVLTMNYHGQSTGGMAWLQPDGMLDAVMPTTLVGMERVLVQADGRLLIAGTFTQVQGVPRNRVARLNADGTLDLSFDPGTGPNNAITAMALQPDGKVLLGGFFTAVNGTARNRIVRLLPNGQVDLTFDPGSGANSSVRTISVLSDGRVFIGGNFTDYAGTESQRMAILGGNGALLTAYPGTSGVSVVANTSVVDGQDRIWVGGEFSGRVRRLLADGSPDPGFSSSITLQPLDMVLLPDNKLLVGGKYLGGVGPRVLRLSADGSVDPTFQVSSGTSGALSDVLSLALLADGRYLAGGNFRFFNGQPRTRLACLLPSGTVDTDHGSPVGGANHVVTKVLALSDGRFLVGGIFRGYEDVVAPALVRTFADGTVDGSFTPPMVHDLDHVGDIALQTDEKVIVIGSMAPRIKRLLPNGAVDATFSPGSGPDSDIRSVRLQADGKLLVAGYFSEFNGSPRNSVARLNATGSLDQSFIPPGSSQGPGYAHVAVQQPDGKVLVGGMFYEWGGGNNRCITRLMPDGSLDPTFNGGGAGTLTDGGDVNDIELLPDGRILIAGTFAQYNGVQRRGVARLLANGELDMSFVPPGSSLYNFNDLEVLPDGRILLVGGGVGTGLIRCLGPDGALIALLYPGGYASNTVESVAVGTDGQIVVGGSFIHIAGVGRNRIARLFGGDVTPSILVAAKVHLGGAFDEDAGLMHDTLRAAALVPPSEPYTALPYAFAGGGGELTVPAVLATTGNNAIVDWVVVELRAAGDPTSVLASRSALVQRDGDVVDLNGISAVYFNLPPGNYHVAIRHRNHLGVMSATPLALSTAPTVIDFTAPATPTWGTDACQNVDGTMVLWPGDANFDGEVKYTGANNDRDVVLQAVGGSTPNNIVAGYWGADVNLDGMVKYTGSNNDRDIVLQTIGGVVPTAVRQQQLP